MELWGKINVANWHELPFVAGRNATKKDVHEGRAVFSIPSGSKPANIALPFCALQTSDEDEKIPVIAIQAEEMDGEIIVGVRFLEGGNGVCVLSELTILESLSDLS